VHKSATNERELIPLLKSKYVQSDTGETFIEAERLLKVGKLVLYVGTPCQVFGLRSYLCKDYDNLFTVDFLCHGVPSPGVWQKYLSETFPSIKAARSAVAGENTVLLHSLNTMPVITGIDFREKEGYGWEKYGFVVRGKVGLKVDQNSVLLSDMHDNNPFMKGFLNDIYLRPSCYSCKFKCAKRASDITLADCWPVRSLKLTFLDSKGVSLIMVNTKNGNSLFDKIDTLKAEIPFEKAYKSHSAFLPLNHIPAKREAFFAECYRGKLTIGEWTERELRKTTKEKLREDFKDVAKNIVCYILLGAHKIIRKLTQWLQ